MMTSEYEEAAAAFAPIQIRLRRETFYSVPLDRIELNAEESAIVRRMMKLRREEIFGDEPASDEWPSFRGIPIKFDCAESRVVPKE